MTVKKWQIDKAVRISDRPTFMTTSLYNLRLRLSINYTITNRGWWRDGGLILKWFTPCLNCFRPFPNRYSSYPIQMRRLLSSVTKDKKRGGGIVGNFFLFLSNFRSFWSEMCFRWFSFAEEYKMFPYRPSRRFIKCWFADKLP